MSERDSNIGKRVRRTLSVFGDISSILSFLAGIIIGSGGTTIVIGDVGLVGIFVIFLIVMSLLFIGFILTVLYFDYKERQHRRENRGF
jgi:hypothetical protein